ncbi:MAG TPA: hypothetical protein VE404_02935 [Verrucomicrobiae bacterium]|nr:hypothetical protein [Verrucomicrobiae bacterium]
MIRRVLSVVLILTALACSGAQAAPLRPTPLPAWSAGPPAPREKPVLVEIPYGILVADTTCPEATHALLNPCTPHPLEVYVVFPPGGDLRDFEAQNVLVRGSLHRGSCPHMVLRVISIAPSREPFTCEDPDDGIHITS